MKSSIRRFLSGVAAAAIALSGLALGVGSAQAASTDGTITVTASNGTAGHTLTAYKIAAYNSGEYGATSDGKLDTSTFKYIVDKSDENAIDTALDATSIKATASGTLTKAEEGLKQLSVDSSPATYGYLEGTDTKTSDERKFADKLASLKSSTWTPSYSKELTADTNTKTFTATLPEGLYLILDTYTSGQDAANSTQSVPMIVGTTFANTAITDPGDVGKVTLKDTTAPITKEVVTKNSTAQDNDPSSFTTNNDPSYNTTDTVYFKLTTTIPNYDGYAWDPTLNNPKATRQLSIVDTFEAGKFTDQTVVSVYDTTKNQKLTLDSDFTTKAGPTTSSATDLNKLTIDFERLVNKAQADTSKNLGQAWDGWESGDTITVIVSGKLSTAATTTTKGSSPAGTGADSLGNNNTVRLEYSNNPSDTSSKTTVQGPIVNVYTHQFTIHKVDAAGGNLQGATFQVSTGGTPLKFTKDTTDGAYVVDKDSSTTDLVSDSNGLIKVKGLKASKDGVTYTVKETKVPDTYLRAVAPTYTVTLKDTFGNDYTNPARSGTATKAGDDWLTDLSYTYDTTQDVYKLVTASTNDTSAPTGDTATVKNVTSITQLPKTGAAGIAMFTIIGVAVIAVAALFAVRARKAAQRA
ncbi:SpaA isopeptide-forming pilin-related protein [Bifidobacterium thermophilum]|uniref:SpaA isopeptide-forming pilin-related protein n=1 Tax=Bifidobacterium thermophilum TaxID=33905 RepID=UPI0039924A3F